MNPLSLEELDRLANELLSALEIREARLLNWGFINGAQALDDLDGELPTLFRSLRENSQELAALWERAQASGVSGQDLLNNLLERKLVFRSRNRYRTRFAETVRSLFLLRQRFSADDWNSGERLVGDMKVLLQRRRYPRRDISPDQLWDYLRGLTISDIRRRAVQTLLNDGEADLSLARFQAQAIGHIFRSLVSPHDSAVVIGAGTGAGKTKAFYIPALAYIAEALTSTRAVQALAIYPRKELLKDQLRETYAEARKLDGLLQGMGQRRIIVGAYYGDVPTDAHDILQGRRENWHRDRDRIGWLCPYFTCPVCGAQSMVWPESDVRLEAEDNRRDVYGHHARLVCVVCREVVGEERLALTRRQMLQQPPDVLFTTTEMLNRRLSNAPEHALFGVDTPRPPRLVLMDEIHLNEGIHGAQVAYLLRRWRHARGQHSSQSLCIVGLSATVTQAETFFARLTGIPVQQVTYITPAESDLVKEGIEYNIVLKGDPLSGTTLLSTSVRSAMLICRVLDSQDQNVSRGAYGRRVFAFSDKLDVINRWYHIEKEVENPVEPYCRFLFVAANDPSAKLRYDQGQNWYFVPLIHGTPTVLTSGLRLDITSSQYAGVDDSANLVIASSTLEVGYNDPSVGAVLQHKTPYSRAAFVQRKGRAGRQRTMRPWTVLVTSAYGFDRWAFQHAESLFDPVLPPLDLPLENYYVQKIQAAFVLMDWLAIQLKQLGRSEDVWRLLRSDEFARDPLLEPCRRVAADVLLRLLESESSQVDFCHYLRGALQLSADEDYSANTLLWGEPRPLLLEVIPTMLRQLETSWQSVRHSDAGNDQWQVIPWSDGTIDRPLPEFVPAALFSDLKSPDLIVNIPEERAKPGEKVQVRASETLSVALAMSEFVPGKVNKRFARKDRIREAHWLELPPTHYGTVPYLELTEFAMDQERLPEPVIVEEAVSYNVFCPRIIDLACVPRGVRPTSSAYFRWASRFDVRLRHGLQAPTPLQELGQPLRLPAGSPWLDLLPNMEVYTQGHGVCVEVVRLAVGVNVSTRYETGGEHRAYYAFAAGGEPAALGFVVDADAIRFQYARLDTKALRLSEHWEHLYGSLSAQFFLYLLQNDERTVALKLSDLELDWLWHLTVAMLIRVAVQQEMSLADAAGLVMRDVGKHAKDVLSVIFQNRPVDAETQAAGGPPELERFEDNGPKPANGGDADTEPSGETEDAGYLQSKLLGLMREPTVQAIITDHLSVLWDDDHTRLDEWLSSVYAFSLGAALFRSLAEIAPDTRSEDLYWDVDESAQTIWITEAASGGVGLAAKLADTLAMYPRRLERQLWRAIEHCPRHELANYLGRIAAFLRTGDKGLAERFNNIRVATDLPRIEDTQRALSAVLDERGIPVTRTLGMALNTKYLRPNSGSDTDELIAALVDFWRRSEERLRCVIDLRVVAVAAVEDPGIQSCVRSVLARIGEGAGTEDPNQVYNLLQSLLWLDCQDACPDCINVPQRYQRGPRPSRALLAALLPRSSEGIVYGAEGWLEEAQAKLASVWQVVITCRVEELTICQSALLDLIVTPLDVGYQALYPDVEGIRRTDQGWSLQLTLAELSEG